jgi:hypothetical protein
MLETCKFFEEFSIKNEKNEKLIEILEIISNYFKYMLNNFILIDLNILLLKFLKVSNDDFLKF